MLISSPFLPLPVTGETKDQYLDRSMVVGAAGDGGFPVSFEMNWHGGVHLTAPTGATDVRAIADGEVAFVRAPTARSTDPKHPLNYRGGWTDDGVLVIKHETDIGAVPGVAATATAAAVPVVLTQVVFYSVYVHLGAIEPLVVGDDVFRMGKLGTAGSIYGVRDRIHLQIVCDDANVQRLIGRSSALSVTTANGRSDVIFGKLWYFVPTGAVFHGTQPVPGAALPPAVFTSTVDMLVSVEFVGVDAIVRSFGTDGTPIGASVTMAGYVRRLTSRAATFFAASQSAGVELMRYGRVIGADALSPANAANWLQAPHPSGSGFVDVNATGVNRMSDGDFPSWDFGGPNRGWVLVDGSTSADGRCTDPGLVALLDLDHDSIVQASEVTTALADPTVQLSLSHKICKFATEWDPATIDTRLSWLKTEAPPKLTAAEYQKLHDHASALCFWSGSGPGIAGVHWHFHPREFIRTFKKCLWLSQRELAQCLPRRAASLSGTTFGTHVNATFAQASTRAGNWTRGINLMLRKHLISESPERVAHFLAQVLAETGLQFVVEIGGSTKSYAPFFGRGLIQLTRLANYRAYGTYRAFPTTHPTTNPAFVALGWDPDTLIASSQAVFDAVSSADTAGFYWLTHSTTNNGLSRSDAGTGLTEIVSVSKYVNGNVSIQNLNGLDHRIGHFLYLKYVLMDLVRPASNTERLTFTWRRHSAQEPVLDAAGNPVLVPGTTTPKKQFVAGAHSVDFPLEHQRP
jgi:hydroxyethylthiazole kinase